ncbi:hypothetical protein EYF80_032900 [Liparis tanakae]|uniref:Uncharacterized protein n=1 Tax=Liparis tanakae TaxID=230148 RepID=A0A4Z2GUK6_9TELE|nr:hypothetical protein EYF80_032900 [Liparis tanakae]
MLNVSTSSRDLSGRTVLSSFWEKDGKSDPRSIKHDTRSIRSHQAVVDTDDDGEQALGGLALDFGLSLLATPVAQGMVLGPFVIFSRHPLKYGVDCSGVHLQHHPAHRDSASLKGSLERTERFAVFQLQGKYFLLQGLLEPRAPLLIRTQVGDGEADGEAQQRGVDGQRHVAVRGSMAVVKENLCEGLMLWN